VFVPATGERGEFPLEGKLAEQLRSSFGSLDSFKGQLSAAAAAVQGSGWAWLGYNAGNRALQIATCANQDPLQPTTGEFPVQTCAELI